MEPNYVPEDLQFPYSNENFLRQDGRISSLGK
jgi:hypothetical protein